MRKRRHEVDGHGVVREIQTDRDNVEDDYDMEDQAAYRYCAGLGSRFASLEV